MQSSELSSSIFEVLKDRYTTQEQRAALKINAQFIEEVLSIASDLKKQNNNQLSASAIESFQQPILNWVQRGSDFYIPVDQIIYDLRNQGWNIEPPEGM